MILTKFSLRRQITLLMIYGVIILFSIFSFSQLKIDFFPDITFPIAGVVTNYPGVGPEDIENLITRPVEEAVSSVKNIEKVSSQSFKGSSIVTLEFKYGTDMQKAENDIRKNLDYIRDYLPADASEPIVFVFDPSMMPISYISISSPYLGPAELRKLSEEKIEPLLERVEGVASVQTMGGLQRQINVNINPVLLASYDLSPNDISQAIQYGSGLLPSGTIETTNKSYNLRVFSEYTSLEQIKKTIITYRNGIPVYVKDVADVEDGYKENANEVRADFGEGVMIMIMKQSDANTVITSRRVKEAIPDIISRLPQGTKFSVIWDQADFIMRSITNLRNSALIAFVLAFVVIYFFLRNLRGSIIMGISIPLSIITTFAVMYLANVTLNIISMAGLALAVGMLVDNSIVVLENIYRHRELGENKFDASDIGTTEVGMAITASTLTTISVFVPVLFVPNITGQLFKDMVLTITFSLAVSLLVALTIVPMMSANLLKFDSTKKNSKLSKLKDKFGNWIIKLTARYSKILHWSLYHKKVVLLTVTILFILSIILAAFLGGEFLPKTDQALINVLLESPAGTPIEKTRLYAYKIEDIVKEVVEPKDLESISIFYGTREGIGAYGTTSSTIELFVKLTPREQRKVTQFEIQDRLRKKFDEIPGITYTFQEGGSFTTEKDIEVKVIGFDINGAKAIANELKSKMEKINGLVDISLNTKETTPEIQVHLNKDMLNHYNLSTLQVAMNISTAIQGRVASQYREKGDEYDIYVQFAREYRKSKAALEELDIALPTGGRIKLKDVAEISEEQSTPTIFRENQSRFVSVGCGLSGIDLSTAVNQIKKIISETPIPSDYQVIIGGTAEDQQEAFFYLTLAFIAAVLLVYMIMASQFESLIDPLIIMFTVPLSIIGVFFFLALTGTPLSVMALVGVVMLVGIAVNNGIVLVDYINQQRRKGMELYEAVEFSCKARMRPVLMTALTTILGMVPLAIELGSGSETWSPLAKAVIGGLIATTLLTLIVIPTLYVVFEHAGENVKNYFRKRRLAREQVL
ncbi:MAG: efflux RND transporter permease subunit [Melioribacter sp.]|uniref:efflux RND transporter permease subunit n=1 Tax=Rosettibacter primus TaxID=3111523 RepID=UPI00247DB5FD|nr:efflux RND transporter permease subunit [Melioribacter sp.]